MNVLNKLKIRIKLVILIIFMVGCTFVIGLIGYRYTKQSQEALTNIYKDNLITIELLSDASTQIRANFSNIQRLMILTDPASQKKTNTDIDTRLETLNKDLEAYKNTELDAYEVTQMGEFTKKLVAWESVFKKLRDYTGNGRTIEALNVYQQTGEAAFTNLQESISNLVDYNIKEADTIYLKNHASAREAIIFLSILIISITLICIILGILITNSILKPITGVVSFIKKTSDLDLVYDPEFETLLKYKGEIGTIVDSVFDMRKALRSIAVKITDVSGDLAVNSRELFDSTDESTKTINQVVNAISEIAEGNSTQAEMVTKTNATMKEVSGRIEEVNKAIITNAENAEQSLDIVAQGQKAVDLNLLKMQDNLKLTAQVGASIHELSELMLKVNTITGVINEIASQTNLLALNAAIEAARAGEAGKGFAVVAEEIKKLAEGSSAAVSEITEIINNTVDKNKVAKENMDKVKEIVSEQERAVNLTKDMFGKIKETVEDIVGKTKTSAGLINKIDRATKEISIQTQDMAAVAEEAAASSEEISASSEEQLTSMEQIASASGKLSSMAGELKEEIAKFKI
jgi:methyl-accepting chemotaxis protein